MDGRTKHHFGRCGYYFCIALIWLFVIALGLEVFERARVLVAERAYARYFEEQNRKVYRMAPLEELKRPEHQFAIPQSERGWSIPVPASSVAKEAVRQSREDYAAQSAEHRSVILALQGELHLRFTRDGTLLESLGEPLLEQHLRRYLRGESDWKPAPDWQAVFDAISVLDDVKTFRTHLVETTFPMLPHHYTVTVAPGRDERDVVEVIVREITDELPIEEQILGDPPPPESPWERLFFSYKKNWGQPGNLLVTNNYGFRDDDVVAPKPPGVFRIVCVGGSTTEEGNDNASTYPNIMERKLRQWLNTDRIDVVNAGLCGLTSYSERRRINDFLELEPDLILYYNAVNDVCHKHFPSWLAAPNPWRGVLGRSRVLRRIFNRRLLPPDDCLVSFINATTMRNLRAMAVAARERNVRMAVCSFACPTLSWHDFRARRYYDVNLREVWHGGPLYFATYRQVMALYNRVLKKTCEEEGILYVPVAEHFIAGDDHFFDICHMTPLGLELKTNIIGAYIRDFLINEGFAKNESNLRGPSRSGR